MTSPEARPRKGRGAVTNPSGRFERTRAEAFDDGWGQEGGPLPPLRTTLLPDTARRVISRNESPDVPFEMSVNPYRGCEHGCIYCFARPTHAYLGLSPGLDFETRLFYKADAAGLLESELRAPGYRPGVIALGANTDPYQPVERTHGVTRAILEVLAAADHPVAIVTKSNLVLRDLDILAPMARKRLVKVMVSVTTLDRTLARTMEPRAPTPARRLEAIDGLSSAGVPTGVLAAPMIPALNDSEVEAILEAAAGAGAVSAGYVLVRLPLELKGLFEEWLETHVPLRAKRVLNRIRDTRGGELYSSGFGERMRGTGPYADMLAQRFKAVCRRLGLDRRSVDLDCSLFRPPRRAGDQLDMFSP